MLVVRDRETGTIIEEVKTVEEGEKLIEEYEDQDREDGCFDENFYEIAEIEEPASERIQKLRKITGLSQTKFGDRYGIPMRTIQNWENGASAAPGYVVDMLERLVWEDFDGIGLRWCVIDDCGTEIFITPAESKEAALEEAQIAWDRLWTKDKARRSEFFVGLANVDDQGNYRELPDGTFDADIRVIARRWK